MHKDQPICPTELLTAGMNELEKTPGSKTPGKNQDYFATPSSRLGQNSTTPNKSGGKKVFGRLAIVSFRICFLKLQFSSFERGLDKVKNMLTPRKRINSSDGPSTVSGKSFRLVRIFNYLNFFSLTRQGLVQCVDHFSS